MDTPAQQIIDAAMKLTPAERVELVDAVLESIPVQHPPNGNAHSNEEIGQAWGQEIDRRKAEAHNGQVNLVPKSDAIPGPRGDA